jgi:hypothetical protein
MIVHIEDEPDLHFTDDKKLEIIEAIQYIYFGHARKNIKIYKVEGSLKKLCTTEADLNFGINVIPSESQRDKSQDLFQEGQLEEQKQNKVIQKHINSMFDKMHQSEKEDDKLEKIRALMK